MKQRMDDGGFFIRWVTIITFAVALLVTSIVGINFYVLARSQGYDHGKRDIPGDLHSNKR